MTLLATHFGGDVNDGHDGGYHNGDWISNFNDDDSKNDDDDDDYEEANDDDNDDDDHQHGDKKRNKV